MNSFEGWAVSAGFNNLETDDEGRYEDDFLQHAYLGWCAFVDSDRARENACYLYNAGYMAGHEDTVEGVFTPISHYEYKKEQMNTVLEIFHEVTFRG